MFTGVAVLSGYGGFPRSLVITQSGHTLKGSGKLNLVDAYKGQSSVCYMLATLIKS